MNITVVLGHHSGIWDASEFFCPYFMLVADHARQGQLLLWTPLVNSGCPAGVDPQVGAWSPWVVGLGAITGGHEFGFRIYWLSVWGFGGLGMLLLARHLKSPPWGGAVAAIAWMASGVYVGHAQHTCHLAAISFLPWVLWRLDVSFASHRLLPATEAGALFGLAALGGYPSFVLMNGCYAGAWALARSGVFFPRDDAQAEGCGAVGRGRRTGFVVVALLCFFAVGSAVLLPTYLGFIIETQGYSDRSGELTRQQAVTDNALHPGALATFASPYLAVVKLVNGDSLWRGTDVSTCSVYLSPIVLILAGFSLFSRPRDPLRWCLACVAAFCLLCVLGTTVPLRGWLYDLLPPMRYFRHCGMLRCYAIFTMPILAALAARDWAALRPEMAQAWWRRVAVGCLLGGVVAGFVFAAVCLVVPTVGDKSRLAVAAFHLALAWFGAMGAAFAMHRLVPANRSAMAVKWLVLLLIADACLTTVQSKAILYGNRQKAWQAAEAGHVASLDLTERGLDREPRSPLAGKLADNSHLPLKVPVADSYTPLDSRFYRRTLADPALVQSVQGGQRVWFSPTAAELPPTDEAFDRFLKRVGELGRPCLVVTGPQSSGQQRDWKPADLDSLPAAEPVAANVQKYVDNELVFDVVCADEGWLLVTDRWARGWTAQVNGVPAMVQTANFAFRAVRVAKGENRIALRYAPFGYPWLLMESWGLLGLVGVASVVAGAGRMSLKTNAQEAGLSRPA